MLNKIFNEDCLEGMKRIPDRSVDMILTDLPYGTTRCKWDSIIPFEPLWEQYERVIKDNGAIVLTASQPFTSALVMSKPNWFKHEWIWDKMTGRGHLVAKYRPMQQTEDVLVFSKNGNRINYYPIMVKRDKPVRSVERGRTEIMGGKQQDNYKGKTLEYKYPKTLLRFKVPLNATRIHPTQKPVALFEYLIKTYTNEGETVLDSCMGSGTTAIACINTNRNYIGFELDEEYYKASLQRIEDHTRQVTIEELMQWQ